MVAALRWEYPPSTSPACTPHLDSEQRRHQHTFSVSKHPNRDFTVLGWATWSHHLSSSLQSCEVDTIFPICRQGNIAHKGYMAPQGPTAHGCRRKGLSTSLPALGAVVFPPHHGVTGEGLQRPSLLEMKSKSWKWSWPALCMRSSNQPSDELKWNLEAPASSASPVPLLTATGRVQARQACCPCLSIVDPR